MSNHHPFASLATGETAVDNLGGLEREREKEEDILQQLAVLLSLLLILRPVAFHQQIIKDARLLREAP